MHLLVTDRLCCVRCGPAFGLILLAEELTDRRVIRGWLGCANCRERYPVDGGFGDFRPPPRDPPPEGTTADPATDVEPGDPEETFRLAALLGVREGPGLVLLRGAPSAQAARLAALIEEIEVVALDPALRGAEESPGVTRIDAGARFPFFTGSLRGVVLEGTVDDEVLAEAVRVLGPSARLVVRFPGEEDASRIEGLGLTLLLETRKAVVAERE